MAMAHRQQLKFIGRLPGDSLVAMFAQVPVDADLDHGAVRSQNTDGLPAILTQPMMWALFIDCFAECTLPAGTDSPAGTQVADWSGNVPSCPRRREPSS